MHATAEHLARCTCWECSCDLFCVLNFTYRGTGSSQSGSFSHEGRIIGHCPTTPPKLMDSNASTGRSVDIELGGQEVITIDLDNLDPNPEDVLDLLKDGQCNVWVWTKLAGEYWRRGYLDAAERIALSAVECQYHSNHLKFLVKYKCTLAFQANGTASLLPPIYSLLANIQIAYAQKAPKLKLSSARAFSNTISCMNFISHFESMNQVRTS